MTDDTEVAVIGAGVTGLEVARQLDRRDVRVELLERAEQPGGVVRSRRLDGRLLELGPQRLRSTGLVEGLVGELGLDDETVVGRDDLPLAILRDGVLREAPLGPSAFLRTDLLSTAGKLRFLAEPLTAGASPDETVAGYLVRSFGREAARCFLGPLYAGIYGSDPEEMPMRYSLGRLLDERGIGRSVLLWAARRWLGGLEIPPPLSFGDGLQRLPEAMHADVQHAVRLGVEARSIRRNGERFVVRTSADAVAADTVVVATAADDAARLLGDLDAPVDGLDDLSYNPLAVVHLDADPARDRMGYQTALGEGTVTRGVTWNDALFDREGVHTAFLGGAAEPDAVDWSDDELATVAVDEFEAATDTGATALAVHRTRMPAFDESWSGLEDLVLPEAVTIAGNYTGRAGITGRIRQARRIAGEIGGDGPGDDGRGGANG